jgi:murein DD-endopeptidase MepM/ murein hydrolase activator NlpD
MAGLLDVGYVAKPGEDFASTGPHLDVRVLKDGKYIDPGTIRSLLTRLKVGKERTPLWQQQGSEWKPSAPITSGFGPRVAPAPGASTYHPAHDYGLGAGTPLAWEGAGTFTPGKGYGSIQTADTQGNPYEIRLLHTKGGKQSALAGQSVATQPQQAQQMPQGQQVVQQPKGNTYIVIPDSSGRENKSQDFLANYLQNMMQTPQLKPSVNPTEMLMAAVNQTPNYFG